MADFADTHHIEIVEVIGERALVDAESYQRRYLGDRELARGFYAVTWPGGRPTRYDDSAHFIGPFPSASAARQLQSLRGNPG